LLFLTPSVYYADMSHANGVVPAFLLEG
jgi:hypothetical protein